MEVEVRHSNIEDAIKLLKRQVMKDGILKELKFRRFYEKPSVKKKRKRLEARRRRLKEERKLGGREAKRGSPERGRR